MSIKLAGDFSNKKDFYFLTSDLQGTVCLIECSDGTLRFSAKPTVLMKKRIGPSYALAPLLDFGKSDSNQAYLDAKQKAGNKGTQNIYQQLH